MSDALRFALDGELTIYRAAELREALMAALPAPPASIVIDLAEVSEIDSSGVQLLVATQRAAIAAGVALAFSDASPAVRDVLGLFNLSTALGVPA
ncbi:MULTISPECIES: STAS domain-containing protein [Cupriavidus]|uniref:STAS domain-containing protein n=1 Tax=Cupriavidus pauculus TaxID=82633 RepID=A0A5P2HHC2_9BURK|nr:STAS domain-containing protein [Cupriavidus pauculus]QET06490.1 STAS domain-containing protein [Cupriavidus pauculus]